MPEKIVKSEYSEVMQKSYIDYSMSVITSRALPDIRDGLKPVQRRVLYAMDKLGLNADKPHRKSARIVGDAMGKYHPHGDSSIYETLVVMSQDFKKGMALVDGHGNFGSIEGDGAAAMRYTEAKLKKFTQEVFLEDIDKNVVDFMPNFDGTEQEPVVLPVKVPNILINGAEGIAVGMATSIPTHNLSEVVNACIFYLEKTFIDNELVTLSQLLRKCPGPDFPTGGVVVNKSDLYNIYDQGTGKIKIRGTVEFEEGKGSRGKDCLVITQIPYTMVGANISKFMQDVYALVESRDLTDISDISNESNKDGIRIVLELKKGADVEYIKNVLYKKTKLEDTFGVNMLTIVDGRPETLGLKEIIGKYAGFRFETCRRKYEKLLSDEQINKEVKEGLIRAVDCIDLIIEVLRGSKNQEMVKKCLTCGETEGINFKSDRSRSDARKFNFTDRQTDAILSMRLSKLIGLEIEALNKEYEATLKNIETYTNILGDKKVMTGVIIEDLENIKKEFGLKRRTKIEDAQEIVIPEKPVEVSNLYMLMDRFGYVKTVEEAVYDKNKESIDKDNKIVIRVLSSDSVCFFTDKGNMHTVGVSSMPLSKYKEKGKPIDNISTLKTSDEDIVYSCVQSSLNDTRPLLFVTEKAMVKQVEAGEFFVSKRKINATKLNDDDYLKVVIDIEGEREMIKAASEGKNKSDELLIYLESKSGYKLRFLLDEVPVKKKAAVGVRGMKLNEEDRINKIKLLPMEKKHKILHRDSKGSK